VTEPSDAADPSPFDPAELTDAELEAVAAGKQWTTNFMTDIFYTGPKVSAGKLSRSDFKTRMARRSYRPA
jgi:hypothetical protein